MSSSESIAGMNDKREPNDNEVVISHASMEVPLERILLIRKDDCYCAIKFIRNWTEIDEDRMKLSEKTAAAGPVSKKFTEDAATKKYAIYESYYQGDGSGDFSKTNVIKIKETASLLPYKGSIRPFINQPGNPYVKCNSIKLTWGYKKKVYFSPPNKKGADYGFELAPTPWSDISQVNVFDPKVKWYKHEDNREWIYMPIDRLWGDQKTNE